MLCTRNVLCVCGGGVGVGEGCLQAVRQACITISVVDLDVKLHGSTNVHRNGDLYNKLDVEGVNWLSNYCIRNVLYFPEARL